jgi:TRAP-type C4-dicarboxylate transport system permease small subunit
MMMKWVRTIVRGIDSATRVLNWVGYISLAVIVLVTSIDVIGRYCFNMPLLGSNEILELSMAVLGGFAMLYTTIQRGHISVDLFFVRFSRTAQLIIDIFGSLVGFGIWGIIGYQVYLLGLHSLRAGDTTGDLGLPVSPFQFTLALGISLYSLTLLIQSLRAVRLKESGKKEEGLSI